MNKLLGCALCLISAAWIASANQQRVRDVRRITDVRVGMVDSHASGSGDKWSSVTFEHPFDSAPVVTATVCDLKEPGEHNGVFAVLLKDVDAAGFRFRVQEADTKLAWSEVLRLHWIAVAEKP